MGRQPRGTSGDGGDGGGSLLIDPRVRSTESILVSRAQELPSSHMFLSFSSVTILITIAVSSLAFVLARSVASCNEHMNSYGRAAAVGATIYDVPRKSPPGSGDTSARGLIRAWASAYVRKRLYSSKPLKRVTWQYSRPISHRGAGEQRV